MKYFLNESTTNSIVFTPQTSTDNPFDGFDFGTYSTQTFNDVDGDGKLDLLVGEGGGTLKYFLNESSGGTITFTEKTSTDNPFDGFSVSGYAVPRFSDIDGDGDPDFVVAQGDGTFNFYLNESTASTTIFTQKTNADNPFNSLNFRQLPSPAFIDINGDKKTDLVVGGTIAGLQYWVNESTGNTITFTQKIGNDNPFDDINMWSYSSPTFVDLDGDNKLEMVMGGYYGRLLFLTNYYGTWIPIL